MAVYMQGSRRHRITALVGAGCLIVGGGIGYLVGHSGSTSTGDVVAAARSKGEDAATALQRLPIEYQQAVTNASGESTTTITDAIDEAAALLADAYDASPWLGPALHKAPDAAIDVVRQDVLDAAPADTFEQHINDAVTAIGEVFNLQG
jgi:hypothetical protein